MPPPPLTDDEVRQCLLLWWEGEYVRLGISYDAKGLPDNSASKEAWLEITPEVYRREWGKAYRYGLADDAITTILSELTAPADYEMQLAKIIANEDLPSLFRLASEMCDTDEIYAWGVTRTGSLREFPWWVFFPFIVGALCFILATVLSEPIWSIGGIGGCVLGMAMSKYVEDKAFRQRFEPQLNPQMTFAQLAENIHETAKSRGEEMLQAAELFRQSELPSRDH